MLLVNLSAKGAKCNSLGATPQAQAKNSLER